MAHIPVNHPARRLWRAAAAVAALYLLVFGIAGLVLTAGEALFSRLDIEALGLRTNPAFAVLSLAVGAVVLAGVLLPGNTGHFLHLVGGGVFWLAGLVMLTLLQTPANVLNFEVSTCVVSFVIGTVLFGAGMYGKSGTVAQAANEERFRHSGRGAVMPVMAHRLSIHPGVRHDHAPS